ncbi:MAG: asparaginase domain-containing protein [Candidatus Micrarchaeota archaeon]|nr:asparaginase domain-containing protein [Candidatus Micrarchaeota archaeon]
MKIRIFTTGGTFDKEYDPISQKLVVKLTRVPKLLERGWCKAEVVVTPLMSMDSLDMADKDRLVISENCKQAKEERILITHGTDTMDKTAAVLASEIKYKTIVLTGAVIPYEFKNSDSPFNLGAALAFVQTLPHGVYIAMNGMCFQWDKVKKNTQTGFFEEIK